MTITFGATAQIDQTVTGEIDTARVRVRLQSHRLMQAQSMAASFANELRAVIILTVVVVIVATTANPR